MAGISANAIIRRMSRPAKRWLVTAIVVIAVILLAGVAYLWLVNPNLVQEMSNSGQSGYINETEEDIVMSDDELRKLQNDQPDEAATTDEKVEHYQRLLSQAANATKCDVAEEAYTQLQSIRSAPNAYDVLMLVDCYQGQDADKNKSRLEQLYAEAKRIRDNTTDQAAKDNISLAIEIRQSMRGQNQ